MLTLEGGNVTTDDSEPQYDFPEPDLAPAPASRSPLGRGAASLGRLLRRGMVRVLLASVAIVALIGGAYLAGAPAGSGTARNLSYSADSNPAATAGPVSQRLGALDGAGVSDKSTSIGAPGEAPAPASSRSHLRRRTTRGSSIARTESAIGNCRPRRARRSIFGR